MISNWHKRTFEKTKIARKSPVDAFPDIEQAIRTIIPAIEAGECAKDALTRIYSVSESNRFTSAVIRDKRVMDAMMKRALRFNITSSSYYRKAKEMQMDGK